MYLYTIVNFIDLVEKYIEKEDREILIQPIFIWAIIIVNSAI